MLDILKKFFAFCDEKRPEEILCFHPPRRGRGAVYGAENPRRRRDAAGDRAGRGHNQSDSAFAWPDAGFGDRLVAAQIQRHRFADRGRLRHDRQQARPDCRTSALPADGLFQRPQPGRDYLRHHQHHGKSLRRGHPRGHAGNRGHIFNCGDDAGAVPVRLARRHGDSRGAACLFRRQPRPAARVRENHRAEGRKRLRRGGTGAGIYQGASPK